MKKVLLASVLAIASFPGYAHAAQGYEEGVPCHDFSGKKHENCVQKVLYCERKCGAPTHDESVPPTEKLAACVNACLGKDLGMAIDRDLRADTCADYEKQKRDYAQCLKTGGDCSELSDFDWSEEELAACKSKPSARVTVTPPYQGPPPIGWVYQPYTQCANPPQCSMGVVNVQADGLNVRTVPNGPPVMALVNGTVFYPLQRQGDWLLVAPA